MFADLGGGLRVFIEASLLRLASMALHFPNTGGSTVFACYLVHYTTLIQFVSFVLKCHQKRSYSVLWFDVPCDLNSLCSDSVTPDIRNGYISFGRRITLPQDTLFVVSRVSDTLCSATLTLKVTIKVALRQ